MTMSLLQNDYKEFVDSCTFQYFHVPYLTYQQKQKSFPSLFKSQSSSQSSSQPNDIYNVIDKKNDRLQILLQNCFQPTVSLECMETCLSEDDLAKLSKADGQIIMFTIPLSVPTQTRLSCGVHICSYCKMDLTTIDSNSCVLLNCECQRKVNGYTYDGCVLCTSCAFSKFCRNADDGQYKQHSLYPISKLMTPSIPLSIITLRFHSYTTKWQHMENRHDPFTLYDCHYSAEKSKMYGNVSKSDIVSAWQDKLLNPQSSESLGPSYKFDLVVASRESAAELRFKETPFTHQLHVQDLAIGNLSLVLFGVNVNSKRGGIPEKYKQAIMDQFFHVQRNIHQWRDHIFCENQSKCLFIDWLALATSFGHRLKKCIYGQVIANNMIFTMDGNLRASYLWDDLLIDNWISSVPEVRDFYVQFELLWQTYYDEQQQQVKINLNPCCHLCHTQLAGTTGDDYLVKMENSIEKVAMREFSTSKYVVVVDNNDNGNGNDFSKLVVRDIRFYYVLPIFQNNGDDNVYQPQKSYVNVRGMVVKLVCDDPLLMKIHEFRKWVMRFKKDSETSNDPSSKGFNNNESDRIFANQTFGINYKVLCHSFCNDLYMIAEEMEKEMNVEQQQHMETLAFIQSTIKFFKMPMTLLGAIQIHLHDLLIEISETSTTTTSVNNDRRKMSLMIHCMYKTYFELLMKLVKHIIILGPNHFRESHFYFQCYQLLHNKLFF